VEFAGEGVADAAGSATIMWKARRSVKSVGVWEEGDGEDTPL
jgi:hypothetical protein